MPKASAIMATTVDPGFFVSIRKPYLRSFAIVVIFEMMGTPQLPQNNFCQKTNRTVTVRNRHGPIHDLGWWVGRIIFFRSAAPDAAASPYSGLGPHCVLLKINLVLSLLPSVLSSAARSGALARGSIR